MFSDARELPDNASIEADICIVGAGAAGITIARELVGTPLQVCLLESGGFELEPETQALAAGEVSANIAMALDTARLRFFGGTTNHWMGYCRPLDAGDFERRAWVPYSGWPISRAELDPYYARAQTVMQLGAYDYAPRCYAEALAPFYKKPIFDRALEVGMYQRSAPLRFGSAYRGELEAARNVTVHLHANVVEIEVNESGSQVLGLKVAHFGGRSARVRAGQYVLASGGIENARLLLASDARNERGLGNGRDLVGRYFMEHPSWIPARVVLNEDPDVARNLFTGVDERVEARLQLTEEACAKAGILRFMTSLRFDDQGLSATPGWRAITRLRRQVMSGEVPDHLFAEIRAILADLDGVSSNLRRKFLSRTSAVIVDTQVEQAPNPDSRVRLLADRDALGVRKAHLDWNQTELDRESLRRALEIMGQEFGRHGLGRVRMEDWVVAGEGEPPATPGFHHMGTTRMSTDPACGVVDRNCRVHEIANLYVAGSSVFPTSGVAHPTLTIVALALRLADLLKAQPRRALA